MKRQNRKLREVSWFERDARCALDLELLQAAKARTRSARRRAAKKAFANFALRELYRIRLERLEDERRLRTIVHQLRN